VRTIAAFREQPCRVETRCLKALRAMKYDRWLTIESFGFALGELSAAASIWRDIAPTPES